MFLVRNQRVYILTKLKPFYTVFLKSNTRFCLSLHYNEDNSYLFLNEKEICKFKTNNVVVNFPTQFCLGNVSI